MKESAQYSLLNWNNNINIELCFEPQLIAIYLYSNSNLNPNKQIEYTENIECSPSLSSTIENSLLCEIPNFFWYTLLVIYFFSHFKNMLFTLPYWGAYQTMQWRHLYYWNFRLLNWQAMWNNINKWFLYRWSNWNSWFYINSFISWQLWFFDNHSCWTWRVWGWR